MFKKTPENPQFDLFATPSTQMGKREAKKYDDPHGWHNLFYANVTSKIDETVFSPLFKEGNMGAPNASIRVIIAMSIIKEGFGCSDEELFEKCQFDLLVRKALGLFSLSDVVPSIDTYYLLRRRICEYENRHGINLMEKSFEQLTGNQLSRFKISGKSVRMDSKLIGSNIARYSRFEIIHNTFRGFIKGLGESGLLLLNPKLRKQVVLFLEEDAGEMVYRLNSETIGEKISDLGLLIYQVLKRLSETTPGYDLLHRVFHEQYEVVKGQAILRPKEDIAAKSVQNHNDPDADYREKGGQKVKGYSVNITETCDDADEQKDKPNLIVNVQVKGASAADNDYLEEAVTNIGEKVSADTIEKVYADGAYQSKDNREFAEENSIELITSGLQGRQSKYDIEMKEGELVVTHIETGEIISAHKTGDKWRIATGGKSKYRYFTHEQIATAELRRKLTSIPQEEQRKRNNVEATIFQYCFHTRNNKTRYRGLLKHKLFSFARCLWINHVRLANYLITTGQRAHENGLMTDFRHIKSSIMEKLFILIVFLFPRFPRSRKTGNKKSTNYFLKLQIATF
ncbi:transposase [Porphyromonadaceae sp. NP-X]|nr:transposase [Porphyromonadaceae sp. NP-X]